MAEEVWMLQTKKADFKQIRARFRIDPVACVLSGTVGSKEGGDRPLFKMARWMISV